VLNGYLDSHVTNHVFKKYVSWKYFLAKKLCRVA